MESKLKAAVIGAGGREHAIIRKLKNSPRISSLIAIPGNGGIEQDGVTCIPINALDISAVVQYCKNEKIDYVVVTPDDPLALGMVDALGAAGIRSFGPVQSAARLESSKIFAKNLMRKYNIPTADYRVFTESSGAIRYARDYFASGKNALVVKADGLALGKGVTVCLSLEEAEAAVRASMDEKRFGASGEHIVIEECLTGPEVSVLSFCDGNTVVPMVSCMDHKRAWENDEGPNTGGMGCIAPNPFYTPEIAETCMETIFIPTVKAARKEAAPFKGCLYFGLMLTDTGPKVIEYNCRFGDPETQAVMPLLESDLLSIMLACTDGALKAGMVRFKEGASACVVAASEGYPAAYKKGYKIEGIDTVNNAEVYCAGVKQEGGSLISSGGRVLSVSATAPNLEQALREAYHAIQDISFENKYFRTDIGQKALSAQT